MVEDKDIDTKIGIESRIATRLVHISNAMELGELKPELKEYVQSEIRAISALVARGLFEM